MKEAKDLLTGDSGWGRRMPEGALAAFSFQEGSTRALRCPLHGISRRC